jgi:large exoprotein involved in heme utilization and adhesion
VVIINPNGVVFDGDSTVDAVSQLVSTADTSTHSWMGEGVIQLDKPGDKEAAVVLSGSIKVAAEGMVGVVAPKVVHTGVIEAKLGKVQMSGAEVATIDLYGDGILEIAVGDAISPSVINSGAILAAGGRIDLSVAAGQELVQGLILVKGAMDVSGVEVGNGGEIIVLIQT